MAPLPLFTLPTSYRAAPARAVELVVAELCATAVGHGTVAGPDVELRLTLDADAVARVEVSDARHEAFPPTSLRQPPQAGDASESGYGLRLVAALADTWGAHPRAPIGTTDWAELRTQRSDLA
jgi:anti-sigma regulatory factor (Ser/Thr protein kinase)